MGGSISFDRAAEIYDRTRVTDPAALVDTIDMLERELGDRSRQGSSRSGKGPVLEIGVGTGALALPLRQRGVEVVGVDLSPAMLARLRSKASEPPPVVVGDATRLPFAIDAFAGAFARWVLHLIPAWPDAVAELCRVVAHGGVIVVEPGGYRGEWLDIWKQIDHELHGAAKHVGLDVHEHGFAELDEAFARHGARPRELPPIHAASTWTLALFFEEARARAFSWTWRVQEGELLRGIDAVEVWARERYGDELGRVAGDIEMNWRAYDLI